MPYFALHLLYACIICDVEKEEFLSRYDGHEAALRRDYVSVEMAIKTLLT
jgi:hypothetical protein